jgi:flagellar hook-associated protein 3 FlgL
MRITNQMLTNTSMHNINRNKNSLSILDQQYSSGKKIQRPSEDPIIAVRALKLRTNLSELNQYYEKNIPDAKSWMDVTESALTNINTILTKINSSFVQGANDPLTPADRTSIMQNLVEYKKQIYQEGNSNYAGRYVFTGYKTDKSLVFNENTTNLKYSITENFTGKDIETISKVVGEHSVNEYKPLDPTNNKFGDAPTLTNTYRIRLSYDGLDNVPIDKITYKQADGTIVEIPSATSPFTINAPNPISKDDPKAYTPGPDSINFIAETGEIILGANVYESMRLASDITLDYDKSKFNEGDLRPEHYFNCKTTDQYNKESVYTKSEQQIQYEINFNQKLTVNTQGSDALVHGIGRDIDEVVAAVQGVVATEEKIAEVKKMLEDKNITGEQTTALNALLGQLDTELVLKNKLLHDKFEQGIAGSSKHQETINTAVADLGSRYVRLELTEDRLSNQQVDFEDLLSTNEDVDIVETFIKLTSKEAIYNASLSAASKVIKNTLLDFI